MLERRIRLNFPGVIIGVVDVGGGVAISLLLSLSLRRIKKNTSLLLLNIYIYIYVCVCVYYYSLCVCVVFVTALITYVLLVFSSFYTFFIEKMHFSPPPNGLKKGIGEDTYVRTKWC